MRAKKESKEIPIFTAAVWYVPNRSLTGTGSKVVQVNKILWLTEAELKQ